MLAILVNPGEGWKTSLLQMVLTGTSSSDRAARLLLTAPRSRLVHRLQLDSHWPWRCERKHQQMERGGDHSSYSFWSTTDLVLSVHLPPGAGLCAFSTRRSQATDTCLIYAFQILRSCKFISDRTISSLNGASLQDRHRLCSDVESSRRRESSLGSHPCVWDPPAQILKLNFHLLKTIA